MIRLSKNDIIVADNVLFMLLLTLDNHCNNLEIGLKKELGNSLNVNEKTRWDLNVVFYWRLLSEMKFRSNLYRVLCNGVPVPR